MKINAHIMKKYFKDALPILILFICFAGGLYWYSNQEESIEEEYKTEKHISTQEAIEQYNNNVYGDAVETKCSFCGGIGRVGFAGESEAQVKRTGNGLGNYCISCKGTGKIKTWKKK